MQVAQIDFQALVAANGQKVVTTSYQVAKAFKKRHSDVLRAIKNMRCSAAFRERNFALTVEIKKLGNIERKTSFYEMTERGFMFLVMGFNGEAADAIKEGFIGAFEWMADQLNSSGFALMKRRSEVAAKREQHAKVVSGAAREMRYWQDDAKAYDAEIAYLDNRIQPQLAL